MFSPLPVAEACAVDPVGRPMQLLMLLAAEKCRTGAREWALTRFL